MKLQEGWFSNNEPIPDKMINSYLNDYLVFNYMRIYNIFDDSLKNNYNKLVNELNKLRTFKDLDKEMNKFINEKAKNQPKENAINTAARIAKSFGIPDPVINASIKDFKNNELSEFVYEEATVEKNPYQGDSIADHAKASMWRPDTNEEDNEDWMMLWKEKNQQESSEKWTVIRNSDGSWSLRKGKTIEYNFDPNEKDEAEEKADELNKKLSESIKPNKNESISSYLIRMKNLFTE